MQIDVYSEIEPNQAQLLKPDLNNGLKTFRYMLKMRAFREFGGKFDTLPNKKET
ncbi:hypothetical protein GCM10011533_22460 [Streptosporangium jomthongense]|nr:hypothetical protein GCM10011533_22460 [Streptosporangium jomthongense]